MYKVVIVDDDLRAARRLHGFISSHSNANAFEISTCASAAELDSCVASQGALPDAAFVSIELEGGIGGIDLVARRFPYGCATQVVYLANSLLHAPDAYRTQHAYLLAKPVEEARVHDALDRVLFGAQGKHGEPLLIKSAGSIFNLRPEQIAFVESDRRKVRIHTTKGMLELYSTLTDVANALPNYFTQCHKSFLVNMAYVEKLGKTDIVTTTGEVIPVSQRRKKDTVEALAKYTRML